MKIWNGFTVAGQAIYDNTVGSGNLALTNARDDSEAFTFSFDLKKSFDMGLDLRFGYSYTEAEDVNPQTSSVAFSNFNGVAVNDVNRAKPANSDYVTRNRFTFRATYAKEFFRGLRTVVSLDAFASEGQPQSYTFSTQRGGLSIANSTDGRHLLYVPTGLTDPNVVFDAGFDDAAFFEFVNRRGISSGLQDRNSEETRWTYRVDLGISQEFRIYNDYKA